MTKYIAAAMVAGSLFAHHGIVGKPLCIKRAHHHAVPCAHHRRPSFTG